MTRRTSLEPNRSSRLSNRISLRYIAYSLLSQSCTPGALYPSVVKLMQQAGQDASKVWTNPGKRTALVNTQLPPDNNVFGFPIQTDFKVKANDTPNSWRCFGNPYNVHPQTLQKKRIVPRQLGMGDPINSNKLVAEPFGSVFENSSTFGNIRVFNPRDIPSLFRSYIQCRDYAELMSRSENPPADEGE